jgi:hypothetical protein
MVPCPDYGKSKSEKSLDDPLFRDIMGEFHSDDNLGNPGIDDLVIGKCVLSERLDVEADR